MKKARSNFQCQDMYAQHYILFNKINQKDPMTNHTPIHNPYIYITIIRYQKKHQLNNWMEIIRKECRKLQEFLYYSRTIDPKMLIALNFLAAVQTKPIIETTKKNSIYKL